MCLMNFFYIQNDRQTISTINELLIGVLLKIAFPDAFVGHSANFRTIHRVSAVGAKRVPSDSNPA